MDSKTYQSTASNQADKAPKYLVAWTDRGSNTRVRCAYATRSAAKACAERMARYGTHAVWGAL